MNQRLTSLFLPLCGLLLVLGVVSPGGLAIAVLIGTPIALMTSLLLASYEARRPASEAIGLASLFTMAVMVRWVVATAVQLLVYGDHPGLFAPDETYYLELGAYGAAYLSGYVPVFPFQVPGIGWVISICYFVFGQVPLLPKFLNGIAGGWTAVLTALIAVRLFPPAAARRAGILVALIPSLVLWSSLATKDNAALLGVLLMLHGFLSLREKLSVSHSLTFAFGLLCLASNRSYEVVFVAVGFAVGVIALSPRRFLRNLLVIGAVAGLLLVVIQRSDATAYFISEDSTLDHMVDIRIGYAQDANSAVNADLVDTSTTAGMVAWVPIGLAYFFLAPIPFTGGSAISIATSPEMLLWYFFIPGMFRGAVLLYRMGRMRLATPLIAYFLVASLGWSLTIGNVGTLYRYRAQVLFFPLICLAADMVWRRESRRQRSKPASSAPLPVPAPRSEYRPGPGRGAMAQPVLLPLLPASPARPERSEP